jgi:hypothetical protein
MPLPSSCAWPLPGPLFPPLSFPPSSLILHLSLLRVFIFYLYTVATLLIELVL